MATTIMNKKRFLTWLKKQLKDDQIIVMSQELTGSISVNKKKNEKKVTFGFAADAFKQADSIKHFAFGETPVVAFAVCEKKDVSEDTLKMLKAG